VPDANIGHFFRHFAFYGAIIMVRQPAVAGQFYPGAPEALKKLIEKLTKKSAVKKKVFGIVSPHAGLAYSGQVAGDVYSRIKLPGTIIVIGPNHTGRGRPFSLVKKGSWATPLGQVEIDEDFSGRLLKASRFLQDDLTAHSFEHSIEVQLPFLQFFKAGFKFVPIMLSHSDLAIYREIGNNIADCVRDLKKDVLIVASSDMTHYEEQKIAQAKDREAINAILELNEEKLLKKIDEFDISMCGYAPVAVMLAAVKKLGAKTAELVKYQTSGETTGDYSAVVGYAGIIVS